MATILRTCPNCRRQNRVGAAHLAKNIRCGACKTMMGPMAEPVDADAELFDEVIREIAVPVLVDFWAAWCGPCRMAAPEVQKVAAEMAGRAIVLKLDTERHPDLATRYNVQGIPNFVVLRNGRLIMQHPGLVPAAEMTRWLKDAAAGASAA